MAEHKLLGIIVAVGLVIVAAIFMVIDRHSSSPDDPEDATVAVAAPEPTEPSAQPQVEYPVSPTPLSGKIVVSKRPVEVLSSPSASASAVFGFPAGRPFRVLGGDGDYVKIQDLRSGASGWIEEAALEPAPPPAAKQRATGTSTKKTTTTGAAPKRKQTSSDTSTAAAEPKPEPKRQRRGLFGGGGVFGGLFGGR
jgi:hypothetical protein